MIKNLKNYSKFYIMGCGNLGEYLRDFLTKNTSLKFKSFLDNSKIGENIYKPEVITDKNSLIVIASINYMYEMYLQLKQLCFNNIITFAELTLLYPELQQFNQAYNKLQEDYNENKIHYDTLNQILSDRKSKDVLSAIIKYRQTYDINIYPKIADNINNQYFEEFMPKNINTFIDGGAYDGDTVLRAIKHNFDFKKIYFFEPDTISLNKAKNILKNINGINYFPYGLSDKEKFLKFDTRGNLGSCFSDNGNIELKCVALDDIVKEEKAFIKLDIEGFEIDAINGAKRLFQNNSPFAICVYHKPEHIWGIPKLIQNINPNYKFYLRHYTNNIFETVLYGVPICD